MASLTLTPSRFGNSFNSARDTHSANVPSMAETLPSVDFGFNDLRDRMAQFTARFDEFIERGRKRVLEERNVFRLNVAEMEESQRAKKSAIVQLESKSSNHAHILAKEAAEAEEMDEAIRTLTEQKEDHVARRDQLKTDITSTQTIIRQKRDAQTAYQRALEAQSRHNIPEMRFWERCLGLRIEASGFEVEDQLRFVFAGLNERDESREAWFELNMAGADYQLVETSPHLESDDTAGIVDQLNHNRELGAFLKGIRSLLSKSMIAK